MQKEEKIKIHEEIDDKKAKNLYNSSVKDQNSVFYAAERITNGLIKKAKTSLYAKDQVFVKNVKQADNEKSIINEKPPLNAPYVEKNRMLTV